MKTNAVSVLKPGLLVSLKTSLVGGVEYSRLDIEREYTDGNGERRARWETAKRIPDPAEFEAACKVRTEARALVSRVCCPSAFGLLCPSDRAEELEAAIEAARWQVREFNGGAQLSRVEVYVLVGRIAQDDAEAARAISSELRGLIEAMQAGIAAANPDTIREAASKAKALGGMLTADTALKVEAAIREARGVARALVKAGEQAAGLVGDLKLEALSAARFAFLDLDGARPEAFAPSGRGLDLAPAYDNGDGTRDPMNEAGDMVAGNAQTAPDRRVLDLMAEGLSRADALRSVAALDAGSVTPLPFPNRNLEF